MRVAVSTRKGLFFLERRRAGWRLSEPCFLGVRVSYACDDPRDGSLWACLGHGHWGPKLQVARNGIPDAFEPAACPAFPEGCQTVVTTDHGQERRPAVVEALCTLVPAGAPGTYLAGTVPGGLFLTTDGGASWTLDEALWRRRLEDGWFPGGGGLMLHSICVDPRDPRRIHVGVSCAGVYATEDGGRTWEPRNKGVRADFLPDPEPAAGQDTHILRRHPLEPDLLWQQNHCGNYRSTDGARTWEDVTRGFPPPIGFSLALDERDPLTAWTVPMDSDERRVAPGGAMAVSRTRDGGCSWEALREGLPQRACYDIVYRHALDAQEGAVVLGTTCGRLFASLDEGESWELLEGFLPPIYAVRFLRGA